MPETGVWQMAATSFNIISICKISAKTNSRGCKLSEVSFLEKEQRV